MDISIELPGIGVSKISLRHVNTSSIDKSLYKEAYNGDFILTESGPIGFFSFNNLFFVLVNQNAYTPNEQLKVTNEITGDNRVLKITYCGHIIYEYQYKARTDWGINQFWPEEEEDVDHLLWFSNIVNNNERHAVIVETRKNS